MGVIRGGLLFFASSILFFLFLAGSMMLSISLSLNEESVKESFTPVIKEIADQEGDITGFIDSRMDTITTYCENETDYVFSYEGYTFVLDCDQAQFGSDAIVSNAIQNFVDKSYYKEYDCDFWDCFTKTGDPLFLVSQKAKDYWTIRFYYTLLGSLILIGLMIFLFEHKPNLFIVVGSLLALSSITFKTLAEITLGAVDSSYLQFFGVYFSRSSAVVLIGLIIGITLLALGIIWRLLGWNFTKKKFSKKDVQEIVKDEVSKSKEVKEKPKVVKSKLKGKKK